ncbi:glycosyltransferase family 2 protein [Paenibacillus chitinolyticus]|uniref:glycosyltransferase family 2 protein n=1 Tax=Paenibacillus chitinolyticus TaxID=79263 RepID=UPI003667D08B
MTTMDRDWLNAYRYNLPFFENLHKELLHSTKESRNPGPEQAFEEPRAQAEPGMPLPLTGPVHPAQPSGADGRAENLLRRVEERITLLEKVRECSDELGSLIGEEPPHMREELAALSGSEYAELLEDLLRPGRASISVVIPVFNEERCIARCLDSVHGLADEIIVLDTGSTDGTVDIIRGGYPHVRIEFAEWQDDFAEIRNRLNDLASGDWIFQLDADEALIGDGAELRAFLRLFYDCPAEALVVSPKIVNHDGSELTLTRRIYRREDGLLYYGVIHEDLRREMDERGADLRHLMTNFTLSHDGYEPKVIKAKNKHERNIRLEEQMVSREPDNIRWHYFLAREKQEAGYPDHEVVEGIREGLRLRGTRTEPDHFHLRSLLLLAGILDRQPQYNEPLNALAEEINAIYPDCTDGLYYLLLHEYTDGTGNLVTRAESGLNRLKQLEHPYSLLHPRSDHVTRLIGEIFMAAGQYKRAFHLYSLISDERILQDLRERLGGLQEEIAAFLEG